MGVAFNMKDFLARLHAADSRARDVAAAEIGDLLEADQLGEKDFKSAVRVLMKAALAERDPEAKESMFNALSAAATSTRSWPMNWDPIVAALPNLAPDCLEHALVIVGFSGDAKYRPRIDPFLNHPDSDVRQEALDALQMLPETPSPSDRRTATKR